MTITDFAYPGEVDEMRQMWNNSVVNLRQIIGAQVS